MSPPASQPTSHFGHVAKSEVTVHLPRLRAMARRILGCDHLADDAVQEGLVALWHEANPPAHLASWLGRTVINRCRHLRRTATRRHRHEHIASEHCELHKGCDNPLHIAIAHETSERLAAVIDTLPTEQREALTLYEQTGLDYGAIAELLEVPVGTVRSRLARARAAVQAALRPHLSPD
ncbi:MAG: RNA polymerase sigma-70 factor (ECF subfamily) [Planctomycetota bacterium]|jgi:RNA polymerase sigma-70 factor (ECF subfamily)